MTVWYSYTVKRDGITLQRNYNCATILQTIGKNVVPLQNNNNDKRQISLRNNIGFLHPLNIFPAKWRTSKERTFFLNFLLHDLNIHVASHIGHWNNRMDFFLTICTCFGNLNAETEKIHKTRGRLHAWRGRAEMKESHSNGHAI